MGGEQSCLDWDYDRYNAMWGRRHFFNPYTSTAQETLSVGGNSMEGSQGVQPIALGPNIFASGMTRPPVVSNSFVPPAIYR